MSATTHSMFLYNDATVTEVFGGLNHPSSEFGFIRASRIIDGRLQVAGIRGGRTGMVGAVEPSMKDEIPHAAIEGVFTRPDFLRSSGFEVRFLDRQRTIWLPFQNEIGVVYRGAFVYDRAEDTTRSIEFPFESLNRTFPAGEDCLLFTGSTLDASHAVGPTYYNMYWDTSAEKTLRMEKYTFSSENRERYSYIEHTPTRALTPGRTEEGTWGALVLHEVKNERLTDATAEIPLLISIDAEGTNVSGIPYLSSKDIQKKGLSHLIKSFLNTNLIVIDSTDLDNLEIYQVPIPFRFRLYWWYHFMEFVDKGSPAPFVQLKNGYLTATPFRSERTFLWDISDLRHIEFLGTVPLQRWIGPPLECEDGSLLQATGNRVVRIELPALMAQAANKEARP